MPVLDHLGIAVRIKINGVAAEEYHDPIFVPDRKYPTSAFKSVFIESRDDTEYVVECVVKPHNAWLSHNTYFTPNNQQAEAVTVENTMDFDVEIDGVKQAGTYLRHYTQVGRVQGVTTREPGKSEYTMRKFRFNPVTTVDTAPVHAVKRDIERAAFLGTIRVLVWQTVYRGDAALAPTIARGETLSIADKALKGRAVSHGTSLGDPVAVESTRFAKNTHSFSEPCAIFQFKYRSKEALREEMIVPRTPSPEPVDGGFKTPCDSETRVKKQKSSIKRELKTEAEIRQEIDEIDEILDLTGSDDEYFLLRSGEDGHDVKRRRAKRIKVKPEEEEENNPFDD